MRVVLAVWLLLIGGVSAQPTSDVGLARKLYGIFLSIPTHPEIIKDPAERKQLVFIAKIAADPSDGIDRVGVEQHGNKATLWLLTKEAEMSGRMALYTLNFTQINAKWNVVNSDVLINGPSSMPKDIVAKCTIKSATLIK